MVQTGADGAIAWTCVEAGPLGLDFGLTELDEGMIGLEVKGIAQGSMAACVKGLKMGMVLQQIDEFRIRMTRLHSQRSSRNRVTDLF